MRDFLALAFGLVDLDCRDFVEIDPRYYQLAEVDILRGDSSKARDRLGWQPKTESGALARKIDVPRRTIEWSRSQSRVRELPC